MKSFYLLLMAILVSACSSSSNVVKFLEYEHPESKEFINANWSQERINLDSEVLEGMIADDVIITVHIPKRGNDPDVYPDSAFPFLISPYSLDKSSKIVINKVVIRGNSTSIESTFEPRILTTELMSSSLLNGRVLFKGDSDSNFIALRPTNRDLDELSINGKVNLEIYLRSISSEEEVVRNYEIDRIEYKDIAWPT